MRGVVLLLVVLAGCTSCGGYPRELPQPVDVREPVFWSLCYDVFGAPTDYAGDCEDPLPIDWGKLPVRVQIDPAYPNRGEAVLKAIRVWNSWLRTDVFYVTPIDPDVIVVPAVGGIFDPAGRADHTRVAGRVRFTISMFGQYQSNVLVLTHELGHVLGLAHDSGRDRSIMHPSGEWYVPWLTRKDCLALSKLYNLRTVCAR